jgi:hypothetical protein
MAHTDNISPEALNSVARQIADLVERGIETRLDVESALPDEAKSESESEQKTPLTIGDSFRICKLKDSALQNIRGGKAGGDLSDWVEQSDLFFHLILSNGKPKAFARSVFPLKDATEESLYQLNVSSLPELIDQAVETIKQNKERDPLVDGDPVVRLLEIPSYHLISLWLYDEQRRESRVLTVLAPERYEKLQPEQFLNTEAFFEGLREQSPLEGIA